MIAVEQNFVRRYSVYAARRLSLSVRLVGVLGLLTARLAGALTLTATVGSSRPVKTRLQAAVPAGPSIRRERARPVSPTGDAGREQLQ